ncbi:MAG: PAS domain S-box protein [Jaaginema sp. PMC 1080.18]|nr:PAS domain S-box protein [Jaaginema sp. PMC 1080.18]MEC4868119.1 PAS domain S-box protein [Jaaginema sp. PMC 1078.18]
MSATPSDLPEFPAAMPNDSQKLTAYLENSPLAYIEWDKNFRIQHWSQQAEELFGWSASEVKNCHWQDFNFIFPEDIVKVMAIAQEIQSGVVSRNVLCNRNYTKSGVILTCEWYNSALFDEAGQVLSLLSLIRDVSDRAIAQEALRLSEERFQEIVNTLDQFFFVRCSETGQYLYISPAYAKIWQRSCESLYANPKSWMDIIHPEDLHLVESSLTEQQQRQSVQREYRIIRDDGEIRWIRAHTRAILAENSQPLRIVGIAEDVTAEVLQRQELARSNAELEQFAYIASHDLQAPLSVVASYARLLQNQYQTQLDNLADKMLDGLVRSTQRMQQLIEDLLTYSRLDRDSQPFQACHCQQIVEDAIANLELQIYQRQATITYRDLPIVRGSRSQLTQLFQNLIANAIKYSDRAPTIAITTVKQGHLYCFAVQDNGIGIAPQNQERIFKIFQRLHNQNQYLGSGIGLALCKKIVERHGGRIWVESVVNRGSTFYFTLS